MRKSRAFVSILVLTVAVAVPLTSVAQGGRPGRPLQTGLPGMTPVQTDQPATLGPMPPLDPIVRFVTPIDPWLPGGLGWDVEGLDDQGDPFCETNRRPTPACDPEGPRPFLHAGFDAAPAPDRVVHAAAAGRVVVMRPSTAFVTGRSQGEGAGIVVLEHDRDGNPVTGNDRILTVYGHVDPEVAVGQIVAEGDRIALTSTVRGDHLHFAVRQGPFNPDDLDLYRSFLPPPGTSGCAGCHSRPLPAPAFPDRWQDPAQLFVAPPSFWLAIYGGPNDSAADVLETEDGALAFGFTRDQPGAPGRSLAVRRLDGAGNLVSQRAYSNSGFDTIKHVERAQDGGVIALAVSYSNDGGQLPTLVKFDAAGGVQWSRQYRLQTNAPGFPAGSMWWEDLAVTADGGYVVTGTARPNASPAPSIVAARLDAAGNVIWIKLYQATAFAPQGVDGRRIAATSDGGAVIAAEYLTTFTPPGIVASEGLVLRIDALGGIVRVTNLGNRFNVATMGAIESTPDGGAIVVGFRTLANFVLPGAIWVVKLNGDGTIAWSSLYFSASGYGTLEESGTALVLTGDGGYVIAGRRTDYRGDPFGFDSDLLLMRLDAAGEVVGQRRLDALGPRTQPLSLRATADGFLLAAGAEADCRTCRFLQEGDVRFMVAHLDADLDCAGQCSDSYDFARLPAPAAGAALALSVAFVNATDTFMSLAPLDTADRRHLCNEGYFGAPPVFESTSMQPALRTVACDRTQLVEAYVCTAGITGVQATLPIVLNVTYDALPLTARVVDGDSTPGHDDVVSVTATLEQVGLPPNPLDETLMLDDGSLTDLPGRSNDTTICYDDPFAGTCVCSPVHVPSTSGDVVPGDGVRTFETTLTIPFTPSPLDVVKGCVVEHAPRALHFFPPGSPVRVILRATDGIGNVAATSEIVTPAAPSMSCSGDACGCCILLSNNPAVECSGLPGLPSPDFPAGLCHLF
ncbi:MAG TPA: M23 family metallopeptidase [Candidatus Polarisedimenticolia bacterium]|nr:M23 family metallopeptidase [Candidatus Polarisedimenticolia bacterium]